MINIWNGVTGFVASQAGHLPLPQTYMVFVCMFSNNHRVSDTNWDAAIQPNSETNDPELMQTPRSKGCLPRECLPLQMPAAKGGAPRKPFFTPADYKFRGYHNPTSASIIYKNNSQNSVKNYPYYYIFTVKDTPQKQPNGRHTLGQT